MEISLRIHWKGKIKAPLTHQSGQQTSLSCIYVKHLSRTYGITTTLDFRETLLNKKDKAFDVIKFTF